MLNLCAIAVVSTHKMVAWLTLVSFILASVLLAPTTHAMSSSSLKVASINLCTDQLLMELADPEQIISISNLSFEKSGSYHYQQAHAFASNEGHAEQIFILNPDIVLAGQYTATHTLRQLKELGLNVQIVPIANSLDSMMSNIELVANSIGQAERGKALLAGIKKRLQKIEPAPAIQPSVAAYDPNGYTVGNDSLRGELMRLAGWKNIASEAGIDSFGTLDLETLVRLAPNAIIESPYSEGTYSRGQQLLQHPAIRSAGINPLVIRMQSNMTICAGPWTLDVIDRLIDARHSLKAPQP